MRKRERRSRRGGGERKCKGQERSGYFKDRETKMKRYFVLGLTCLGRAENFYEEMTRSLCRIDGLVTVVENLMYPTGQRKSVKNLNG